MTTQTEQLLKAWVPAGYRVLREVAATYDRVITSAELAAVVQERSGRTSPGRPTWIGQLLELVARQTARTDDAPLASLCVHADGTAGDRYARVLLATGVVASDGEQRAAEDRLACYRRHATDLPEDGGRARPVVRARRTSSSTTTRTPAAKAPERPAPQVCPTCFMQLPATGICDNCD